MKGRGTSFLTSALVLTLLIPMLTTDVLLGADLAAGENISGLYVLVRLLVLHVRREQVGRPQPPEHH